MGLPSIEDLLLGLTVSEPPKVAPTEKMEPPPSSVEGKIQALRERVQKGLVSPAQAVDLLRSECPEAPFEVCQEFVLLRDTAPQLEIRESLDILSGVEEPKKAPPVSPPPPEDKSLETLASLVERTPPPPIPSEPPSTRDGLVQDVEFGDPLPGEKPVPAPVFKILKGLAPKGRVVLIDGSNLAMRCFFPLQEMCRGDGKPTGLLFGLMKSIRMLQKECKAQAVLVWDAGGTKAKREIYPEYKGNRKPSETHTKCFEQLTEVKEQIRCLGVPQVAVPGEEADDVIASLAFTVFRESFVFIHSSDDDFLQLVDDRRIIVAKSTKAGLDFFDSEKVEQRMGVPPERVPLYRCLDGDTSDNLPGVPRFPRKQLVDLVTRYSSLDELFGNPGNFQHLTPKAKENISKFGDQAKINLLLMTLKRDLPCSVEVSDFNSEAFSNLCHEMEFRSFLDDLLGWEQDFGLRSGFMKVSSVSV